MLKKGSTSGSAVPSAVSSTTATGYLPQYSGNAAALLSPAVANVSGSQVRTSSGGKGSEQDTTTQQQQAGKNVKNCPPRELPSGQAEIIADLHQRMFRDAERRGVVSPNWQ
jgi:hypothetical protein